MGHTVERRPRGAGRPPSTHPSRGYRSATRVHVQARLRMRAGRANCMSNIQQDMIEQTLAILASMLQQAAHDATLYLSLIHI